MIADIILLFGTQKFNMKVIVFWLFVLIINIAHFFTIILSVSVYNYKLYAKSGIFSGWSISTMLEKGIFGDDLEEMIRNELLWIETVCIPILCVFKISICRHGLKNFTMWKLRMNQHEQRLRDLIQCGPKFG